MDPAQDSTQEPREGLTGLIESLVGELEPLSRRHNEAVWLANTTGDARHEGESAQLDIEIRSLFSRPASYQRLSRLIAAGGVSDPLLARQLALLWNDHRAHRIPPDRIAAMVRLEKALESRFNHFRATLDGRQVSDNELRELLRSSPDAALRRRAWEASKQVAEPVVEDLLELVRLRNRAAVDLGFADHYAMMLELDEIDERQLFQVLDRLESGTRPRFEAYKRDLDAELARRFGVAPESLRPWHYADPFFQEAPGSGVDLDAHFRDRSLEGMAREFFETIGFDIAELLARADLYERPGKSQHAFCLCVDRGQDIRVLCNLRPNESWMSTLLHELGHAVYDQNVDPALPFLLRGPAHTLATEASAMLFGRLSKNAEWLVRYAGADRKQAREAGEAMAGATRRQLLVQTRWCLVMCHMERALYRDPGQDLATLWWDLVERYQEVRRPDRGGAPDWASKIHFSVAPVYYHNYMLGEILASQIQSHLHQKVLGAGADAWERYVSGPEVGEFLRRALYRSGKRMDWNATIREATGRDLDPEPFVREVTGSP